MRAAGEQLADASVVVVTDDHIRIDMWSYTPNVEPNEQRRTTILTKEEAQMLSIMLIRAIDQCEVSQSQSKKGKKK